MFSHTLTVLNKRSTQVLNHLTFDYHTFTETLRHTIKTWVTIFIRGLKTRKQMAEEPPKVKSCSSLHI